VARVPLAVRQGLTNRIAAVWNSKFFGFLLTSLAVPVGSNDSTFCLYSRCVRFESRSRHLPWLKNSSFPPGKFRFFPNLSHVRLSICFEIHLSLSSVYSAFCANLLFFLFLHELDEEVRKRRSWKIAYYG